MRPPDPAKTNGKGAQLADFKHQIATLEQQQLKVKLEECDRSIAALGELPMLVDKKAELQEKRELIVAKLPPDVAAEAAAGRELSGAAEFPGAARSCLATMSRQELARSWPLRAAACRELPGATEWVLVFIGFGFSFVF